MQPLTLGRSLRAFLMEEGRGEALCLAPDPVWDEGEEHYFCTPVGAKIIGSAGRRRHPLLPAARGGAGLCRQPDERGRGSGSTRWPKTSGISAACSLPAAPPPPSSRPGSGIEKEEFIRFVGEDQPDAEGRAALKALAEQFSLGRMEDPYDYMAKVREGFSESDLIYPAEEGQNRHSWKNRTTSPLFTGDTVRFPPVGRPIPFQWGGKEAYVLGYGVVVWLVYR